MKKNKKIKIDEMMKFLFVVKKMMKYQQNLINIFLNIMIFVLILLIKI